jgi:hypothetical protein
MIYLDQKEGSLSINQRNQLLKLKSKVCLPKPPSSLQWSIAVKSLDKDLCCLDYNLGSTLTDVWPWVSCLTFRTLNFLTGKLCTIMYLPLGIIRIKWNKLFEVFPHTFRSPINVIHHYQWQHLYHSLIILFWPYRLFLVITKFATIFYWSFVTNTYWNCLNNKSLRLANDSK